MKIFSLLLCLMLCLALVACQPNAQDDDDTTAPEEVTTAPDEGTTAPSETESISDDPAQDDPFNDEKLP